MSTPEEIQKMHLAAMINDPDNPPKHCKECKQLKPVFAYYKDGKHSDGRVRYRPDCKVCYRKRYGTKKNKKKCDSQEVDV